MYADLGSCGCTLLLSFQMLTTYISILNTRLKRIIDELPVRHVPLNEISFSAADVWSLLCSLDVKKAKGSDTIVLDSLKNMLLHSLHLSYSGYIPLGEKFVLFVLKQSRTMI